MRVAEGEAASIGGATGADSRSEEGLFVVVVGCPRPTRDARRVKARTALDTDTLGTQATIRRQLLELLRPGFETEVGDLVPGKRLQRPSSRGRGVGVRAVTH